MAILNCHTVISPDLWLLVSKTLNTLINHNKKACPWGGWIPNHKNKLYSALPHVDAINLGSCTVDGMWDRNSGLFFDYLHVIKKTFDNQKKQRVKPVKTTCEHPWSLAVAPSTPQLKCGQLKGQETDRASTSPEHGDGPKGGPFWKQVLLVSFLLISSTMHFYVCIYTYMISSFI